MLKYYKKPWPHFVGSLPKDFYQYVKDAWNEDDAKRKWNKCRNRSNIIVEDNKINTTLNDITQDILSNTTYVFEKFYPRLDTNKLTGVCSNIFSENPSRLAYTMRDLHIDNGNKLVTGLWYFRHENEEYGYGGNLILHNPITGKEKIFEYGENKIILFHNTPISWNRITIRKFSNDTRRFICMRLESKLKLHNYETKNGKEFMTYEELKNNYE